MLFSVGFSMQNIPNKRIHRTKLEDLGGLDTFNMFKLVLNVIKRTANVLKVYRTNRNPELIEYEKSEKYL